VRVRVIWLMYGLVAAVTAVTYWRLPAGGTYNFDDTGASGAASRVISYLNFSVAIAAIAIVGAVSRGTLAWVAIALCAVVAVPGVVSQDDLTASWVNAPAAIGVVLALWLTWGAPPPRRAVALGPGRVVTAVVLAVWAIPWYIAAAGLYAQDLPLAGHVIQSRQPTPGEPGLASVHRGLHEGLFGVMLAVTALALSRRRVPTALALYLAVMLCYGIAVAANDGWHEQVVKRGWTDTTLPSVLTPKASAAWLALIVASLAVWALWFRREQLRLRR